MGVFVQKYLWHVKNLGDAWLADEALVELAEGFTSLYGPVPGEQALFVRHESDGQLHCAVKVYFPPETSEFARQVKAVGCPPPGLNGLSVLIGEETALDQLLNG